MLIPIARTDTSLLGRWWWTVDRWTFFALLLLLGLGILLSFAASPSVAQRLELERFYFVMRHMAYTGPALVIIMGVSLLSLRSVRRLAIMLFCLSMVLMALTLFVGPEIKGARRWISFGGLSIQASEFLKPAFAVLCGWMFAEKQVKLSFPGNLLSGLFYAGAIGLLLMQPDLGMAALLTLVWFTQFFLAGLSWVWIACGGVASVSGIALAYYFFPHVTRRIDQFLDPSGGDRFTDRYQITQSLEALMNGGFFGRGPGEGIIKKHLPDAHADFVFAVVGEEFGLLLCLLLLGLFLFISVRSMMRVTHETNGFILFSVVGLVMEFGLQAMINISSTINLIPTKGMTLPFISYGGSSIIALSITMGMMLALTRRRLDDSARL